MKENQIQSKTQMISITKSLFLESYKHGSFIFHLGDPGDKFYIILLGAIKGVFEPTFDVENHTATFMERELFTMPAGTSFGELALIYNSSRSCSVKAFGDTILIGLDKEGYNKHFGDSVNQKVKVIKDFLKYQTVDLKDYMTAQQLDLLSTKLIVNKYTQNSVVLDQGSPINNFQILRSGCLALELGIHYKNHLGQFMNLNIGDLNKQIILKQIESDCDEKGIVWIQVKVISDPGTCFYLDEILQS